MIFETKRLLVRQLELNDLNAYTDLLGNIKVMQFTTGVALNKDQCETSLAKIIDYYTTKKDFRVWAVVEKSKGVLVGNCALIRTKKGLNDIGYRFREKYWGNGYGKEIAIGLIKYCFEDLKLSSLYADVDVLNRHSVKILDHTMDFVKEYYIKEEDCTAKEYKLDLKTYSVNSNILNPSK